MVDVAMVAADVQRVYIIYTTNYVKCMKRNGIALTKKFDSATFCCIIDEQCQNYFEVLGTSWH